MKTYILLLTLLLPLSASADLVQTEKRLKDAFEGMRVLVTLDMPATYQGIDVRPGTAHPIDGDEYVRRINRGVAIHAGDSAVVTKVHVKSRLVEFQLNGGGYSLLVDSTAVAEAIEPLPKTQREIALEHGEEGAGPDVEHELLELRHKRMTGDKQREAARLNASRRANIQSRVERAGSRFNLVYKRGVPSDITPEAIKAALAEYIRFPETATTSQEK
jgi:hypothetical protein